jgi:octaprenyl-diphosphate synthase
MLDLAAIDQPIASLVASELEQVTLIFERQLASDLSAVNRLCLHVEQYRGKMLRPTLVLVCGLAGGGEPCDGSRLTDRHRTLAAVAEMIHMATLVHDDVLDEADIRRQGFTVNHLWGNEAAVMLGDYLISNAFHLCSTIGDPRINLALGEMTNTLCAGELLQLHHRNDYGMDEATYFQVIRRKTASLIAACCELGGGMAGAAPAVAEALRRFGLHLGTAFQIRDDLLDLIGEPAVVGKSLGLDLDKGKLTLPLIHHLAQTDQAERGRMLELLDDRDAAALRRRLVESGAVVSTQRAARQEVDEAATALAVIPPSPARDMLEQFTRTVVSRLR